MNTENAEFVSPDSEHSVLPWSITALAIASACVGVSLFLSISMGLKAGTLCFYQRIFAMSAAGTLAVGLLTSAKKSHVLPALTLPSAAAGRAADRSSDMPTTQQGIEGLRLDIAITIQLCLPVVLLIILWTWESIQPSSIGRATDIGMQRETSQSLC